MTSRLTTTGVLEVPVGTDRPGSAILSQLELHLPEWISPLREGHDLLLVIFRLEAVKGSVLGGITALRETQGLGPWTLPNKGIVQRH